MDKTDIVKLVLSRALKTIASICFIEGPTYYRTGSFYSKYGKRI